MTTQRAAGCVVLAILAAGCGADAAPDAYGSVEAREVAVAAESAGRVTALHAREGERLEAGALAAVIESTGIELERAQVESERAAAGLRVREAAAAVDVARARLQAQAAAHDVLAADHDVAARAHERTRRLYEQEAATAREIDQTERAVRVLAEQMRAQQRQMAVERQQVDAALARVRAAEAEAASVEARLSRIDDRLADARVLNPEAGTVLATYVRAGEFVQPGQRLYAIADLSTVDVRAYVTEPQLATLRIGQAATVTLDAADGTRTVPGQVVWIASEAEFTPTPIQTRDERAELVYAVKIRVVNADGLLKIGMPVDVLFESAGGAP